MIKLLRQKINYSEYLKSKISGLNHLKNELDHLVENNYHLNWEELAFKRLLTSNTLARSTDARKNWDQANAYLNDLINAQSPLSFAHIKKMNSILTQTKDNIRTDAIFGADLEFLKVEDFPEAQIYLSGLLNCNENILERAFRVSQAIISFHFFKDGNGRTSKLISEYFLIKEGYLPPTYDSSIQAHHAIAYDSKENDIDYYFEVFLNAIDNSFKLLKSHQK